MTCSALGQGCGASLLLPVSFERVSGPCVFSAILLVKQGALAVLTGTWTFQRDTRTQTKRCLTFQGPNVVNGHRHRSDYDQDISLNDQKKDNLLINVLKSDA